MRPSTSAAATPPASPAPTSPKPGATKRQRKAAPLGDVTNLLLLPETPTPIKPRRTARRPLPAPSDASAVSSSTCSSSASVTPALKPSSSASATPAPEPSSSAPVTPAPQPSSSATVAAAPRPPSAASATPASAPSSADTVTPAPEPSFAAGEGICISHLRSIRRSWSSRRKGACSNRPPSARFTRGAGVRRLRLRDGATPPSPTRARNLSVLRRVAPLLGNLRGTSGKRILGPSLRQLLAVKLKRSGPLQGHPSYQKNL